MGEYLDTPRGPLHWVDYRGRSGSTIVLVHGLGGSAAGWDAVGPRLSGLGRTVAVDLPGYGLSPPQGSWGVPALASALEHFVAAAGHPVVLVGNSMGALVAESVAATRPDLVKALLLVSPATPPRLPDPHIHWPTAWRLAAQATPGLGVMISRRRWARRTPRQLVREALKWVAHKPGRIPLPVLESLVVQTTVRSKLPWSAESVPGTARSIAALWLRRSRFVETIRRIAVPTLVVQGREDRIVSPTSVEWLCRLRPDWQLILMEDTGHTPQLDAPIRFVETISPWLMARLARTA